DFAGSAAAFEAKATAFLQALTGESFSHDGRTVQVTPGPVQRPRPPVLFGGGTVAAARRAARLGDGFMPGVPDPTLVEQYDAERRRLGRDEGELVWPGGPFCVHVADDPDRAW